MRWQCYEKILHSRFLLGTALYPSLAIMQQAIQHAECEIITISLKRESHNFQTSSSFWTIIKSLNCNILPNTAGCHTLNEAITTAEIARELFETDWIKLEIIGDDYNLQPDPFILIDAAKILIEKGFKVFPYCTDDLIVCQKLIDVGCKVIMPWAAPIGTGKGLLNPYAISVLRNRLPNTTIIIDAGIGKPSQAAQALEMGVDAVLLNSAVALAHDPIMMAKSFKHAIIAGRCAYVSGLMPERDFAKNSTPLIDTPFWLQEQALKND